MAKKITNFDGYVEWEWNNAKFAWELGPEPSSEEERADEDNRVIVLMLYDKDLLSKPQVI